MTVAAAEAEWALAAFEAAGLSGALIEWPFTQGPEFGSADVEPAAPAQVRAFIAEPDWPARAPALQEALQCPPWTLPPAAPAVLLVEEREWRTAWYEFFPVTKVGPVVLRPTHRGYEPQDGEFVIDIEPGLGFGTGQHESTRLALRGLAATLQAGDRVLDFGTGSGILACAAARMGAAAVVAIDNDPLAIHATGQAVQRNAVEELVDIRQASVPPAEDFDLVVANLTPPLLAEHSRAIVAAMAEDGGCILSGVVADQTKDLLSVLQAAGLEIQESDQDGEWRAFRASRAAPLR